MKKAMRLLSVMLACICILFCAQPYSEAETDGNMILIHKGSGTIISRENSEEKLSVAGLGFMPALLVISEAIDSGGFDIKSEITVSHAASAVRGSTAFLQANEVISAEALYKSAAMICAGDAIYALCEAVCGNSENAVLRINERLSALGVEVQYEDIQGTGVDLSAHDLAKISLALSDCACYLTYSSIYMDTVSHREAKDTELVNPNRLIRNLQGCSGLLTGSSQEAGYCGAFYVERQGCGYVCVVLGEKTSEERFSRAQSEIESAFGKYHETNVAKKGEPVLHDYPISGACVSTCDLVPMKDVSILTENTQEKPECTYEIAKSLTAPVKAGDCVGNVRYTDKDGNVVGVVELTVAKDIKKATYMDFFTEVIRVYIRADGE